MPSNTLSIDVGKSHVLWGIVTSDMEVVESDSLAAQRLAQRVSVSTRLATLPS